MQTLLPKVWLSNYSDVFYLFLTVRTFSNRIAGGSEKWDERDGGKNVDFSLLPRYSGKFSFELVRVAKTTIFSSGSYAPSGSIH